MQRGLDWYKRDPIAFLDGVQAFGPELIGTYAVILDLIYARGGKTRRDDRHLSGIMGCSMRKAKSLTDELIKRDKIQFRDGFMTNSRAKREAKSRRDVSETRAKQGRKGGLKSGQSRKNNDLDESKASSKREAEKSRVEIEKSKKENIKKKKNATSEKPKKPKPKSDGEQILDILGKYASQDAATSFIDYRNKIKKPITVTAAKRMQKQLELVLNGGGDPSDALGMCEERGWQGVKAEWYFNSKGQDNEQHQNGGGKHPNSGTPQRYPNGASGAHANLIAGLADNADCYSRGEGSDGNDDQIPL